MVAWRLDLEEIVEDLQAETRSYLLATRCSRRRSGGHLIALTLIGIAVAIVVLAVPMTQTVVERAVFAANGHQLEF